MLRFYPLIFLTLSPWCFAEDNISVTPSSCVVKKGWCEIEINLSWQVSAKQSVCIESVEIDYEYCVSSGEQITTQIGVKAKKDLTFSLRNANTQQVLATTTLKVFVTEYKKRRRQRHAWSVIR